MSQWLVRTSQNILSGPFSKDQVCRMIQNRELGPEDEICAGDQYWIYLSETEELLQQLGIRLPRNPAMDNEITDVNLTQSSSSGLSNAQDDDRTDPALEPPGESDPPESTGVLNLNEVRKKGLTIEQEIDQGNEKKSQVTASLRRELHGKSPNPIWVVFFFLGLGIGIYLFVLKK